jgi:hypothetical protein
VNDDPILSKGMVMMTIPSASGDQKTACLVSFHTYKKARKPDGYQIAPAWATRKISSPQSNASRHFARYN